MFDAGQWDGLLASSRQTARHHGRRQTRSEHDELEAKLRAATSLVEQGELSHAARILRSSGLVDGNTATLGELRDPARRPPQLQEQLPEEAVHYEPLAQLKPDGASFVKALQTARRGLSPGLCGIRYEHLKVCLEDDVALELLPDATEYLARADVPARIVEGMKLSQLTAFRKPIGRVMGVAAGHTFRCLVGEDLSRQFQ